MGVQDRFFRAINGEVGWESGLQLSSNGDGGARWHTSTI